MLYEKKVDVFIDAKKKMMLCIKNKVDKNFNCFYILFDVVYLTYTCMAV